MKECWWVSQKASVATNVLPLIFLRFMYAFFFLSFSCSAALSVDTFVYR